jgi:hypothetical protein
MGKFELNFSQQKSSVIEHLWIDFLASAPIWIFLIAFTVDIYERWLELVRWTFVYIIVMLPGSGPHWIDAPILGRINKMQHWILTPEPEQ